jgi:formylglycine-generating enzyme required for sulfatase activity
MACNIDRHGRAGEDLRMSQGETPLCTSPFGARNMVGNVDEWTLRDLTPGPYRSALKGGWWLPARNRCRPATVGHYEFYADFQTGFRCCSSAR